jgi:hypothetical protein
MTERLVAGHLFHCAKGHNAHTNDRAAIAMSASCPLFPRKRTSLADHWMSASAKSGSGRNRRDGRSTAPHQTAMRTARRSKWEIRRHSERRCLNDSSVAVSQAGVNDLIAVKYSHRCSGWPVCGGIAPMRGLDLRHEKSFEGKEFNDEFMKALFGQTQAKRISISTTMMCALCR